MKICNISKKVLAVEEGFVLGNGDFSISFYQERDCLVWRLGKSDVWDRRHDLSDDPKPAHINEVIKGILDEGWQVGTVGEELVALKGSQDQKRMREICQGSPESYESRPYPCPKPVGEFRMHLPHDMGDYEIEQVLLLQENQIKASCQFDNGVIIEVTTWVDHESNVLNIEWCANGHVALLEPNDVWFSLYRWYDTRVEVFNGEYWSLYRRELVCGSRYPEKTTPLPLSEVVYIHNHPCIRQDFHPEETYKNGFAYIVTAVLNGKGEEAKWKKTDGSEIQFVSYDECKGNVQVLITSGDAHVVEKEMYTLLRSKTGDSSTLQSSKLKTAQTSKDFWSKSSFSSSDEELESLWYCNLHGLRSIYKGGKVPPGLFFPSTLTDYSHWHGDYHSNYNFQLPFWGFCTANHPEGLDSYFNGMNYFLEMGRKIAKYYYDCRGSFIQLTAYPIVAKDDTIGVVPLGRMVYMTGWAVTLYWQRYLYTMDQAWLKDVAYPVIKECALFFTDFVKCDENGKYYAFPSNQGEDGFSGNPEDYTDVTEVAAFLSYCLRTAIHASNLLGEDKDLHEKWCEILENYPADPAKKFEPNSFDYMRQVENPPEYSFDNGYLGHWDMGSDNPSDAWPSYHDDIYKWYFGHYTLRQMKRLHMGTYRKETDYDRFIETLKRWKQANGLYRAMSVKRYGRIGSWTESMGVLAVLEEFMLSSWDGEIRLFEGVKEGVDCQIRHFRARGAFLVSAKLEASTVKDVEIVSEQGGICVFKSPWKSGFIVKDEWGNLIKLQKDAYERDCFETSPLGKYFIANL